MFGCLRRALVPGSNSALLASATALQQRLRPCRSKVSMYMRHYRLNLSRYGSISLVPDQRSLSSQDAQETTISLSSSAPFAPSFVIASLTQSSDPTAIYTSRVKGRTMLLDNPARDSRLKKEMEAKSELRKKEKERRKLGIVGRRKRQERGIWKFDEKLIQCVLCSESRWVRAEQLIDTLSCCLCTTFGWDTCQSSWVFRYLLKALLDLRALAQTLRHRPQCIPSFSKLTFMERC